MNKNFLIIAGLAVLYFITKKPKLLTSPSDTIEKSLDADYLVKIPKEAVIYDLQKVLKYNKANFDLVLDGFVDGSDRTWQKIRYQNQLVYVKSPQFTIIP
jgi:hypothetical protein